MSPIFPDTLETDRLTLERLSEDSIDIRELYRICAADPGIEEVTRYLTWSPHSTIKETAAFVERAERRWRENDAATYVVRPGEGEDGAGEIAGLTGLRCDWDRRTGTLGVWLRKRYWGRGYSGERAGALLELAFDRLDLEVVAVTHHVENEQSRRAIEKYVDEYDGRREGHLRNWAQYGDHAVDQVRYSIARDEYETATR